MAKQIIEGANGYLYDVEKDTWNKPMAQKLYTEEQIRKAIELARDTHQEGKPYLERDEYDYSVDEVVDLLTPIELPSDEKINEAIITNKYDLIIAFNAGANWVIKQILNQNK